MIIVIILVRYVVRLRVCVRCFEIRYKLVKVREKQNDKMKEREREN